MDHTILCYIKRSYFLYFLLSYRQGVLEFLHVIFRMMIPSEFILKVIAPLFRYLLLYGCSVSSSNIYC